MLLYAMHRKVNTKYRTNFLSWISANRPFKNRAQPSTIEWVEMRALRIIYLRKLYNLLESLELRTGAVGSV